jgi:hypothetical protein
MKDHPNDGNKISKFKVYRKRSHYGKEQKNQQRPVITRPGLIIDNGGIWKKSQTDLQL